MDYQDGNIRPKFLVFKEEYEAQKYVANLLVSLVNESPNAVIGLSYTSGISGVFKELITAFELGKVSFANVSIFNVFEFVNLNLKNFKKTIQNKLEENFLSFININKENVFYPASYECDVVKYKYNFSDYDNLINNYSSMDTLVIETSSLGNLGLNLPVCDFNTVTRNLEIPNRAKKIIFSNQKSSNIPDFLVTMGIQTIMNSHSIILLAFGSDKGAALYNLFFSRAYYDEWPLTALIYHNNVVVVCDQDAASYIMQRRVQ